MDTKLKSKIEKLLALQESPNENEASIAAAKLSDLLTRYGVNLADIGGVQESVEQFLIEPSSQYSSWKMILLGAIAKSNYCELLAHSIGTKGFYFYGKPTNVEAAKLLWEYLSGAVKRLTDLHAKGRGRSYINQFRCGCADRIAARLNYAHRQKLKNGIPGDSESAPVSAIVCVSLDEQAYKENDQAIKEFAEKYNMRVGVGRPSYANGDGAAAGRAAGDTVSLAPQVKSGNRPKALGGA